MRVRVERWVRTAARYEHHGTERALHDLRVATRRVIAVIEFLAGGSLKLPLRAHRRQFRRVLDAAAPLRANHVGIGLLEEVIADYPDVRPCLEAMRGRTAGIRSRVQRTLRDAVHQVRPETLFKEIDASVSRAGAISADSARTHAERAVQRAMLRTIKCALHAETNGPAHSLRLAVKRLRYQAEIAAPLAGSAGVKFQEVVRSIQEALGSANDAHELRELLAKNTVGAAVPRALLSALLLRVDAGRSAAIARISALENAWGDYRDALIGDGHPVHLYLLRHAPASPKRASSSDVQRPLSAAGSKLMKDVAAGIAGLHIQPDVILSSPSVRTRMTARLVRAAIGQKGPIVIVRELSPDAPTGNLLRRLQLLGATHREILVVGHEPSLRLVALRLTGGTVRLRLKKGGLCRLDVRDFSLAGHAKLAWVLKPAQFL